MSAVSFRHRTSRTTTARTALPTVMVGLTLSLIGYVALAVLLVITAARALA